MNLSECAFIYRRDGIVKILSETCIQQLPSPTQIRILADAVIDFTTPTAVVTTENIRVLKTGNVDFEQKALPDFVEIRNVMSRIENFVSTNQQWTDLCCTGGILSTIVGEICVDNETDSGLATPWCLYKEKLNIKPAGSSGFAPHLDSPSLRVTGLCDTFVTVMIAIDDMSIDNGCLQVSKGHWTEENSVLCEEEGENIIPTNIDAAASISDAHVNNTCKSSNVSNPDGNGRRGAIQSAIADTLNWENIECLSGDVYIFSGWLPHRSACNASQLPRRAVFFTYNHSEDGELSETYYRIMRDKRAAYLKQ